MRTIKFLLVFVGLFVLLAQSVAADTRQDYINDKLDYWIDYAEDLGYYVLETEIDTIYSDRTIFYDLGPGEYYVFAEGGRSIDDLDMAAFNERGYELASDTMADNYPYLNFTLDEWEEVRFELTIWRYNDRSDSGYYSFVLASESRGRDGWRDSDDRWDSDDGNRGRDDRGRRGSRGDNGRRGWDDEWSSWDNDYQDDWNNWDYNSRDGWDGYSDDWQNWWSEWDDNGRNDGWGDRSSRNEQRRIVEDKLDYLYDFASWRRLVPIMDDIAEIDDTLTYSLTLNRGYYVVFGSGGPNIDDLDLHVSWRGGWDVCEDIGTDAAPAVWFYVPNRTTIDIELEVWRFRDGNYEDYACILVCGG